MINESNEVHGHAVLEMMASSGQTYSRDSLIAAINEKFGPETEFVICTGGGMSAETLVDTLIERGKFMGPDDAFVFNPATKCDHD
ncbi:YecH family metal-binding protein [Cerasicoccus maritimus]|uniref:YecH family metal-binding protein n=1 Tax=Cerasicoccus maritimus TaxID=490089 RepID=UPI002852CA1A|nr:YecH family metal-binding protein [Cerasicoccus maritimus]